MRNQSLRTNLGTVHHGESTPIIPKLKSPLPVSVALLVLLTLSGCGGGGGGAGGGETSDGGREPTVTLPCTAIRTAAGDCLTPAQFDSRRNRDAARLLATSSYRNQPALGAINAHVAHATLNLLQGDRAKPGFGVSVAVMDTGVDTGHSLFAGGRVSETLLQGVPNEIKSQFPAGEGSHGTAVTSVIAAQPTGATVAGRFAGVAWGAATTAYALPLNLPETTTYDRSKFDWAAAYRTVLADGADIVNNSYSISGRFIENHLDLLDTFKLSDFYAASPGYEVIAQNDVENPAIFVWAAGNDNNKDCSPIVGNAENCVTDLTRPLQGYFNATSPNFHGGLVAVLKDWQGHNVVVVSVDQDGNIADSSNRCGVAADWCIAAPGVRIRSAYFGPSDWTTALFGGTSLASPMVTGGLALMKQFFRNQMSNPELVSRLFATANKTDIYATRSIYGQGLMDLGAAVTPVGSAVMTQGGTVGGAGHAVHGSWLRQGVALGDGLSRSLAGREVVAFDSLGAPFWFDLPNLVRTAGTPSPLAGLRRLLADDTSPGFPGASLANHHQTGSPSSADVQVGLRRSPVETGDSLLNLAGNVAFTSYRPSDGIEVTAFASDTRDAIQSTNPDYGTLVTWRPNESPVALRAGWLAERNAVLGSESRGAFGQLSAQSIAAGASMATRLGGWQVAADAEIGMVRPSVSDGIVADFSGVSTTAFSARAGRHLDNRNQLVVMVSQPPRIESGSARVTIPVGRTIRRQVLRETFRSDLGPSGRQIDLSATWLRDLGTAGEFLARAQLSRHPGHVDAEPESSLLAGWRFNY